mmetsp:Transcript_29252/g.49832  ORF Transcript_29252/g.49832 Transcript_29252/m.49832 type:complete len:107 (+) Transcript_29252:174-494(+)
MRAFIWSQDHAYDLILIFQCSTPAISNRSKAIILDIFVFVPEQHLPLSRIPSNHSLVVSISASSSKYNNGEDQSSYNNSPPIPPSRNQTSLYKISLRHCWTFERAA